MSRALPRHPPCAAASPRLWERQRPQGLPVFRFALHALIVLILTLLTQIGGIAYLVALAASRGWGLRRLPAKFAIFLLCYAGATFTASLAAPIFGRVPLSCVADAADRLVVRSPIYCLLNRNYVTPDVRDLAKALAAHMIYLLG